MSQGVRTGPAILRLSVMFGVVVMRVGVEMEDVVPGFPGRMKNHAVKKERARATRVKMVMRRRRWRGVSVSPPVPVSVSVLGVTVDG